jgi:16S rRNA (cytidine1402-2'-O)-methyltransferase
MSEAGGQLILVATPIGNLGDMTLRAVDVLRNADAIACEDTRHSGKLLSHFDIRGVPLIAVHEHNEAAQAEAISTRVANGETIAVITDAGMPGVSDPGQRLVSRLATDGLSVSVAPGPSAAIAAVVLSGFATDRFCFEGFLPRKGSERAERLAALADETRTAVLYEAPTRLLATVESLIGVTGGERRIALVRELTKIHEEVWRGTLEALKQRLEDATVKGECVLVLEGAPSRPEATDAEILAAVQELVTSGSTKRDAIADVASLLNVPKNRVAGLVLS